MITEVRWSKRWDAHILRSLKIIIPDQPADSPGRRGNYGLVVHFFIQNIDEEIFNAIYICWWMCWSISRNQSSSAGAKGTSGPTGRADSWERTELLAALKNFSSKQKQTTLPLKVVNYRQYNFIITRKGRWKVMSHYDMVFI